jgi:8-oxo-dGTP diphosphatase
MIDPDTFKIVDFAGAKGLVFIGDKILAFRRDTNTNHFPLCIDLPGGGRDGEETPFQTFKREVKEELNVDVTENDIHFSACVRSTLSPDKMSYFIVTKPPATKISEIALSDEGVEWMLMTPEEYIERTDGIVGQQERVRKYLGGGMGV